MKVTLELINSKIKDEEYLVTKSLKSTICVLTLENGFEVRGESGVVDPANYKEELGNSIARANAVNKIWLLEGYLLQQQLYMNIKNQ
mgnify:CR=1 FL=1|jgi:hypothetical protein